MSGAGNGGLVALSGPVVLDLQALQSRHHGDRGIGRWALEFTKALCAARPELIGAILLNGRLPVPASIEPLLGTGKVERSGGLELAAGRLYHVLSPFELDERLEGIWPAAVRESAMPLVVTLYDLIPELFPDRYLPDPGQRRRYRARTELVRAADRVLAISEATRTEAIERLELDPARVVTIGSGTSAGFGPPASRAAAVDEARARVAGVQPPFLLSVGGEDERKNLEGLLAGYARLVPDLRARYQVVIACALSEGYRAHLRDLAGALGIGDRLLLTGYVDDPALIALYRATELFVFPSRYEGYGLPVAEAMACGAPAAGANTSATPEIAPAAGLFDPEDPADIARAITAGLTDPATRAALIEASQAPPPTWAQAADKAAAVYDQLLADRAQGEAAGAQSAPARAQGAPARAQGTPARAQGAPARAQGAPARAQGAPARAQGPPVRAPRTRPLRVGVVTPLPPQPTGVAVYSARLLEALGQRLAEQTDPTTEQTDPTIELDVFVDALEGTTGAGAVAPGARPPTEARRHPPGATLHPVQQLTRVSAARGGYDVMVYAIGNSEFHTGALAAARRTPGIVLAHDVSLAQLYAFAAHHGVLDADGPGSFAGLAARFYPDRAADLASLPDPLLVDPTLFARFPVSMAKELIGCSRAFLTTSPFAAALARLEADPGDEAGVGVLVHACRLLPPRPPEQVDGATVVSFGVVNPAKDLRTLIDAFARVRASHPAARLVLAGQASERDRSAALALASGAGVARDVTVTGALSDAEWDAWLGRATLAVQLRRGSNGEFSGAVAEALAAGVPTITAGLGSAAGLPDGTAVALPADPGPAAVAQAIGALLDDPARREQQASAARAFARTRSFPAIAEQLERWIHAAASGRSRRAPGTTSGCRNQLWG